jgi:hypothetical protein
VTLGLVLLASFAFGVGSYVARWATGQLATFLNVIITARYNEVMRRRLTGSVFCAQCAGPCSTLLQCENPACRHLHIPSP